MNNEPMIVSLWSGDRVVTTQSAEFVDGVNTNTIDFGAIDASFVDAVTVSGVEATIKYSASVKNLCYVQPDLSQPSQFYECSSLGFVICAESEDEAKILSSALSENAKELEFVVKFLEIADQNIQKGKVSPERSPQPENPANLEGEDWEESEQICPDCGQLVWTASWWDDCLDSGGAAIGTLFECGNCGYRNSQ